MCGVAGVWSHSEPATVEQLRAMAGSMVHRGPDGAGVALLSAVEGRSWDDRSKSSPSWRADIGLAHRRLAILDLSPRGHQPMCTADEQLWITYNGEIYNYVELRQELEALGHRFETNTDTEVLLLAYREWGVSCLSRLNGMWAFAIWDARVRALFCARDRLGVKPFYYWSGGSTFVFGSELKALLRHPRVPREVNEDAVAAYLSLGLVDHDRYTFFDKVQRLPAGHYLWITQPGAVTPVRYWDVPAELRPPQQTPQIVEEFRSTLESAVRLRLRSDVPVGTCLSGGLDSSSVVMLVNALLRDQPDASASVGARQRTFSACFDDARFDERRFVEKVLSNIDASSTLIKPEVGRLWDEYDVFQAHQDEPVQSTSQYAQFCVFRAVRESGVTVTLDGQGADELLAGYPGYFGVAMADAVVRRRRQWAAAELRSTLRLGGRGRTLASLGAGVAFSLLPASLRERTRALRERGATGFLRPSVARRARGHLRQLSRHRDSSRTDLRKRLRDDLHTFSLPALLRYADRNSMAFSIESRMPFLDYRLVELGASLDPSLLIREGWSKWILREAMRPTLPAEIAWRTDKMGFVTPEVIWLRTAASRFRHLFEKPRSDALIDASKVRHALGASLATAPEGAHKFWVWRAISLELWMRKYW